MNIISITHRGISARFFAAITIVSLLMSALPVALLVSLADTSVTVLSPESENLNSSNQVYSSSELDASAVINLKLDFDYDTETADKNDTIYYGWKDGVAGSFHKLGEFKGKDESKESPKNDDEKGHVSKSLSVEAQISNLIITIFEKDEELGGDDIVVLTNITVVGETAPEEKKVDICHWNNSEFNLINVSVNSLGNAHGASGVNDGDIIPVVPDVYGGQNLSTVYSEYSNATGQQILEADCLVVVTPPPVDVCDNLEGNQATVPQGYVQNGENCDLVPPPVDVCDNLEGNQATVPQGYVQNGENCDLVPPPVDVCDNLEGNQSTVPQGYVQNGENCDYDDDEDIIENTCILPDSDETNEAFTIGSSIEPSLSTIFSTNGFGAVDVINDQIDTQVWNFAEGDTDTTTFKITVLAKYAGNSQLYGYYQTGSTTSLTPLFKVGPYGEAVPELTIGDTILVTVSNNGSFGFAMGTQGFDSQIWYSEPALNSDGEDNLAVYNPATNTYLLAFEDLSGGDDDYNDLVVKIDNVKCAKKEPVATIIAEKIVCDDESLLPNWNTEGEDSTITETSAAAFLASSEARAEGCRLESDWKFEWAPQSTNNPDNNLPGSPLYGAAGGNWTTFGPTNGSGVATAYLTADDIDEDSYVWVREVLKDGYIPFTFGPNHQSNDNDVTAEMYCHTDGKNYDNFDRVDGISVKNTYHCLAINAEIPVPPEQCTIVSDTNTVIVDNNDYATSTYEHDNWTATIPGATWIWETYYSADSGDLNQDITRTFEETFTVTDPESAILDIAADNGFMLYINGDLVLDRSLPTYENNFQSHTFKQNLDVKSYLVSGENTMQVVVTNKGVQNSNSMENPAGVLYKLVIESASECERTTAPEEPDMYYIDGYKYEVEGDSESNTPLAGWTINLTDTEGEVITSTTTDQNGHYFFNVEAGDYEVHEVMQSNWTQSEVDVYRGWTSEDQDVDFCQFEIGNNYDDRVLKIRKVLDYDYETWNDEGGYSCDFYNFYTEPQIPTNPEEERHTETGTRVGSRASAQGLVLGASTSVCPFLNDFMQIGWENDAWEVTKLQLFLNIFIAPTPITGIFDQTTDTNVKLLQEKYRSEILDPWFKLGIVPHNQPTGFVYKTTLWKINSIVCPDDAVLPNFDGEDLSHDVDID